MTVEVPTVLPLPNQIEESEWSLIDDAVTFTPGFGYRATQVVRYGTARWRASLRFSNLSQADRHLLAQFVAKVGKHRAFWVWEPSHNLRGSFPSTELLVNPDVGSFWTGSAGRTIETDSNGVRVNRTATDSNTLGTTSSITVTANATYAYRLVWEAGARATAGVSLTAGSTRTGTTYGSGGTATDAARITLRAVPTASPMYVGVSDTVTADSNWTQTPFYLIRNASLVRAFTIDGGTGGQTQTGSRAYVDNLPTAVSGTLKAGDMVEIVSAGFSQMVRLTEDVNTDSSGKGYMAFEPQLRGAVSDNDLVIPCKPMVRMMLSSEPAIVTRPGWYSDVTLECEEAFA